jgi:hypothetical protein
LDLDWLGQASILPDRRAALARDPAFRAKFRSSTNVDPVGCLVAELAAP